VSRNDHLRYSNQEWRVVTEREYDGTPRYADERDHPMTYEPTAMDLQRAEEIREVLKTNRDRLNARQPHIERNARKGVSL
jgi:hypothetical protein